MQDSLVEEKFIYMKQMSSEKIFVNFLNHPLCKNSYWTITELVIIINSELE